jgi:hypothetical protein
MAHGSGHPRISLTQQADIAPAADGVAPVFTRHRSRRVRTAFRETRDGRYGDGIVLFSNFLTWKDLGTTITTSHFVDRTVTRGGNPRDVETLATNDEPTLAEYRQLQRPVYSTWKALHETR